MSFAVFVRLLHPSKLLSRCRNVFVHCSYKYIEEDLSVQNEFMNVGEVKEGLI